MEIIRLLLLDILDFHKQLSQNENTIPAIRDINLIESAVNMPFMTFGGQDLYPTVWDKAAVLAYGLVNNHGFVDGNKRVAMHAMVTFLDLNNHDIQLSNDEIVDIGLSLAEGILSWQILSDYLKGVGHSGSRKEN